MGLSSLRALATHLRNPPSGSKVAALWSLFGRRPDQHPPPPMSTVDGSTMTKKKGTEKKNKGGDAAVPVKEQKKGGGAEDSQVGSYGDATDTMVLDHLTDRTRSNEQHGTGPIPHHQPPVEVQQVEEVSDDSDGDWGSSCGGGCGSSCGGS